MNNSKNSFNYLNLIYKSILLLLSAFFFFISHPNPIIKDGLFITGFFIYLPVLLLVYDCSLKNAWITGGIYGLLSICLFGYWLNNFHPLGLIIVCILYFIFFAVVFTLLKIIELLFNNKAWIIQCLLLCSYEYIKTKGFAGFSYGLTAYTQWKNLYFIQIADFAGVFGLNFILIFSSAWISNLILRKKIVTKTFYFAGIVWLFLVLFSYIYGFYDIKIRKMEASKSVSVAAIQNNEDPWKNGFDEYSKNVQKLKHLTEEALEFYPDIDFVLWPETSVVPSIMYQYYKLVDENRFSMIYSLLNYIDSKNCVFVIGNSHEEEDKKLNTERYNCSMVFDSGKNVIPPEPEMYAKIHLVPFTETFPYKYYFPNLYIKLLNGDVHMWNAGNNYKVFNERGLKFSTPICFEDTFGNDCRYFVKNGARCFMNMSNDAWSKSEVCQYQHLSMAVFRSIENRVPAVRSTVSGQTCYIDSNGFVRKMLPSFSESFLICDVPVYDETFIESLYTKYGDVIGILEVSITLLLLIIQLINVIIKKASKQK